MSVTTTSRVLMSGVTAEPERVILREWMNWVAANGGAFEIWQGYEEGQWFTKVTIHWPNTPPQAPTEPAGGVIEQADRMDEKQP